MMDKFQALFKEIEPQLYCTCCLVCVAQVYEKEFDSGQEHHIFFEVNKTKYFSGFS